MNVVSNESFVFVQCGKSLLNKGERRAREGEEKGEGEGGERGREKEKREGKREGEREGERAREHRQGSRARPEHKRAEGKTDRKEMTHHFPFSVLSLVLLFKVFSFSSHYNAQNGGGEAQDPP